MDIFKAEMNKACQCGGIYCPCCNNYINNKRHKYKKKLNRLARHRISQQDKRNFQNELEPL